MITKAANRILRASLRSIVTFFLNSPVANSKAKRNSVYCLSPAFANGRSAQKAIHRPEPVSQCTFWRLTHSLNDAPNRTQNTVQTVHSTAQILRVIVCITTTCLTQLGRYVKSRYTGCIQAAYKSFSTVFPKKI